MSTKRLRALEAAISTRAMRAARALDVPYPDPAAYGGFDLLRPQRHRHRRIPERPLLTVSPRQSSVGGVHSAAVSAPRAHRVR